MSATEVVTEFFAAVNERRLADLRHVMAADVVDHNKIVHGEPDEPGAAFEGIAMQLAAFADYHCRVDQLVASGDTDAASGDTDPASGDTVVARCTHTGTHTGAHPRMPSPTGRSFETELIFIFTLRDGLISEIRCVSDRLGVFAQLGWDWPDAA